MYSCLQYNKSYGGKMCVYSVNALKRLFEVFPAPNRFRPISFEIKYFWTEIHKFLIDFNFKKSIIRILCV